MTNFNEYGLCKKCHKVIVLRKPGSSVWKLTTSKVIKDTEQHEPILIINSILDAIRIRKRANEIYWTYSKKDQVKYYTAREKSIVEAAKEVGYVFN